MRILIVLFLSTFLLSASAQAPIVRVLTLPAGAQIPMELTRPVWAARVKAGDPFYAVTAQSFDVAGATAIPVGSYIQGTITSFTKPSNTFGNATFHLQFNKLIFPNGYTIVLTKPSVRSKVKVKVAPENDLLLDNGAQITMTLRAALPLDATQVAQSLPLAQPPDTAAFVPATLCRFIPGTPGDPGSPGDSGTPDTVIPGTPDTVIPGMNGAPDTVIPGTPATTIPGRAPTPPTPPTPPTDPIYCPDPPTVISSVPEIINHATPAQASAKPHASATTR